MHKLKDLSFSQKLILAMLGLSIIPIMILGWFSYDKASQALQNEATPDFSSGVRADFIEAMGRKDDKLIILDTEKVFGDETIQLMMVA